MKLVIVESPSKIKTVSKYLGSGYVVASSVGHIIDLPKSKFGIDVEGSFLPEYVVMEQKKDIAKKLRDQAAKAEAIILATDPDREGEAISWHLAEMLAMNINEKNRVEFPELTKKGIENGINNPRCINMDLVNAQQARRVLDRIVGYRLSPFLWKKVRKGLSAGRVQSVAVRIIVDREQEIRAFIPEEYWTVEADLLKGSFGFTAKLWGQNGKKIDKIENDGQASDILEGLENAQYIVSDVKKGTRKKAPAPPFITSTLLQEASRKFGFSTARTMKVAQELYEGVDVPDIGTTGLVTYMRTDSVRISDEARDAGNKYINEKYGKDYLPGFTRQYKQDSSAQDAHEAIRPTMPELLPEAIKTSLSEDQMKLYKIIWERFIASLMSDCIQDTVNVNIDANNYTFRASGYTVAFDGFTTIYVEGTDEENEAETKLPELIKGDALQLKKLDKVQHFTQPPPRFTDATLVKVMKELGIGRPSTYAPTIMTIVSRGYVEKDKKHLVPTPLGEATTELMKDCFKNIVDTGFTADVENEFDKIEDGKADWVSMMREFYVDLEKTLADAEEKMKGQRVKVPVQETDVICELCGKNMVIRVGRFGKFLACPGFPDCKNAKPIVKEMPGECPKCGGKIIERKSQKGRLYYTCETGQDCGFITWDVPTKERCPDCEKTLFKRKGVLLCLDEICGHENIIPIKPKKETAKKPAAKKPAAKKKKS